MKKVTAIHSGLGLRRCRYIEEVYQRQRNNNNYTADYVWYVVAARRSTGSEHWLRHLEPRDLIEERQLGIPLPAPTPVNNPGCA